MREETGKQAQVGGQKTQTAQPAKSAVRPIKGGHFEEEASAKHGDEHVETAMAVGDGFNGVTRPFGRDQGIGGLIPADVFCSVVYIVLQSTRSPNTMEELGRLKICNTRTQHNNTFQEHD